MKRGIPVPSGSWGLVHITVLHTVPSLVHITVLHMVPILVHITVLHTVLILQKCSKMMTCACSWLFVPHPS